MKDIYFGLPEHTYEEFVAIDPLASLASLKTHWNHGPTAHAAVFLPGKEQSTLNFLANGLAEYCQQSVSLASLMHRLHCTEDFLLLFLLNKPASPKNEGRQVIFFHSADALNDRQIVALKYAEDLFERESRINEVIKTHQVYPLIMHSLTTHRRIFKAPGGNIRPLDSLFFTGIK